MNRFLLKTGLFATFLLFVAIGLNSCRKEKPTTATISVTDTAGNIVEGAKVRLCPVPSLSPDQQGVIDTVFEREEITDFEGKVTFDYTDKFNLGQAGYAVLNICVFLPNSFDGEDSLSGKGIIKVEPEMPNQEDVIAFPGSADCDC
ncbi:MAG: hypothetical protein AB8B74_13835 [Crocinitomicaceae bacterium]